MMTLPVAGMRIQRELTAFEEKLDETLRQGALLLSTMLEARQADGAGPTMGQSALIHFASVQDALVRASTRTVKLHQDLRRLNDEVRAVGDENGECPWPDKATGELSETVAA